MNRKLTPWVAAWCGLGAVIAAGRAEEKAPVQALKNATVFDGPGGTKFKPATDGSEEKTHAPMTSAVFWTTHADLYREMRATSSLTMFEGVSRERLGKGDFSATEKAALFQSDGQWFLKRPHAIPAGLAERVREIVMKGVRQNSGVKLCGGFHADLRMKWEGGVGNDIEVLVCFGCHEIKLYGVSGMLYADFGDDQAKALRDLLPTLWPGQPELPKGPAKVTE
jgi:hypothetical protein